MSQFTDADMDQLFHLIDGLLISVGLSALILGAFLGVYLNGRYELWLRFKRGGDYCPLCNQHKGQGGNP